MNAFLTNYHLQILQSDWSELPKYIKTKEYVTFHVLQCRTTSSHTSFVDVIITIILQYKCIICHFSPLNYVCYNYILTALHIFSNGKTHISAHHVQV